jgi:flavin-dependent dehydrogenase
LNIAAAFDPSFVRSCGSLPLAASRILNEVGWPSVRGLCEHPWKGTTTLTRTMRCPAGDRVLAIGDAAGYVEPFTGEGISWALEAAVQAASILHEGWRPALDLQWTNWQRCQSSRNRRLIRSVAWILRRPRLTSAVFDLIGYFPELGVRVVHQIFNPDSIKLPPLLGPARRPAPHTAAVHCI